jgi:iron(III) transport system permease protein
LKAATRSAAPRPTSRTALAGGLSLLVALWWLIVSPLVLTLADTPFTALRSALVSSRFLEALASTLWLSVASTVLAALVGVPLALLFDRVEIPGRALAGRLLALPIALPPLVGVLTFMFLWGESGFLARASQTLLGL